MGDFICAVCAKVRLEDDPAITAFLQNEHASTTVGHGPDDQSVMDVSAHEAGGSGGNKPSIGGVAGGGQDLFDESQPMSTDEDEDSYPGLSQGSKVQGGPCGRSPSRLG